MTWQRPKMNEERAIAIVLAHNRGATFEAVGKFHNITGQRARQIYVKATHRGDGFVMCYVAPSTWQEQQRLRVNAVVNAFWSAKQ